MRLTSLLVVLTLSGCAFFDEEFGPDEPTGGGSGGASGLTGGGGGGGGIAGGGGGASESAVFDLAGYANTAGLRMTAQTSLGPVSVDFSTLQVTAARYVDDAQQGITVGLSASDGVMCALTILDAELGVRDGAIGRTWNTSGLILTTTASTSCSLKSADGRVTFQNLQSMTGTLTVTGSVTPGYRREVGAVDFQVSLTATARGLLGDDTTIREETAPVSFQASGTMTDSDCTLLNGRPCDPPPTGGSSGTTGGGAGGGGGTSTGGSCADVPRTYIGDVQFDSICAAAVCYQRTGNSAGVQWSCQSLSGLSGPSPSQCPAC